MIIKSFGRQSRYLLFRGIKILIEFWPMGFVLHKIDKARNLSKNCQMTNAAKTQTLEDKLKRLKEIQASLETKSVNLSESMVLVEEAFKLKTDVEQELKAMENRLIDLSKTDIQDI